MRVLFALALAAASVLADGVESDISIGVGIGFGIGVPSHPSKPSTPQSVLLYKTFLNIGCWSDSPQARLLHDFEADVSPLTVQACINKCNSEGLALAGLEIGRECYCGNAILNDQQLIPRANCTTACDGNANQACGGAGAINLYLNLLKPFVTLGPPFMVRHYKQWKFLECTQDSTSNRQFPTQLDIPHEQMSVPRCLDSCAAAGFSVAALQFAQECWCGNVELPFPAVNETNCNEPCTDEANEFCGGGGFNQVYFLPSANFTTDS